MFVRQVKVYKTKVKIIRSMSASSSSFIYLFVNLMSPHTVKTDQIRRGQQILYYDFSLPSTVVHEEKKWAE